MSANSIAVNSAELVEPTLTDAVQIYAVIKRSSKYRYQQRTNSPFPVHFGDYPEGYMVFGNDNQYRIEDLRFYVKVGNRFVGLS